MLSFIKASPTLPNQISLQSEAVPLMISPNFTHYERDIIFSSMAVSLTKVNRVQIQPHPSYWDLSLIDKHSGFKMFR